MSFKISRSTSAHAPAPSETLAIDKKEFMMAGSAGQLNPHDSSQGKFMRKVKGLMAARRLVVRSDKSDTNSAIPPAINEGNHDTKRFDHGKSFMQKAQSIRPFHWSTKLDSENSVSSVSEESLETKATIPASVSIYQFLLLCFL